ncbi:LOW QUALITY PROTEIN: proline-rich protein PRCC-like [Dromiciops gliroides]|uniref:LOW QUALITY PROTEIN: proline-rich protein PRCC-like n=1 Tax=Dromiciops gliroides TaxID=33562 RepID=UPI001CC5766E|nr:LOW QUALITY PROTEIN: proline-rich protein PRCC-like [Dromiciops gliroides]
MSLVTYASSEESKPEAEPEVASSAPAAGPSLGVLFPSLPLPKGPPLLSPPLQLPKTLPPPARDPKLQPLASLPSSLGGSCPPPGLSLAEAEGVGKRLWLWLWLRLPLPWAPGLKLPSPIGHTQPSLRLSKPKKRTRELVRIPAPELHHGDSDSEEDEPTKKKTVQGSGEGTGLSALLPQPKNLNTKETSRLLLPCAFSRKPRDDSADTKLSKLVPKTRAAASTSSSSPVVVGASTTTPSPSAIKAAAKSAALQVTKGIKQEEDDSDEEVAPENFFSLSDKAEPPVAEPSPSLVPAASEEPPPGTEPESVFQDDGANAPLEFNMVAGSSGDPWVPGEDYSSQPYNQFPTYGDASATGSYSQDYYSSGYYPVSDRALAPPPPQEITPHTSFIEDEAFKRLQGKRNQGRVEISFVEIKGGDQLSGAQQWMAKSLTEEKTMKSFSKKKGEQPPGQQRRKHQITYLIHQAKEQELELKKAWLDNKLSHGQTQAKYGF